MGLFDFFKKNTKSNVVDNQSNKDYIFSALHNAMKKNICDKFNPLELAKKFNLPIENLEIDYWYDIVVERTKLDDVHSYSKETPINEKLKQNIKSHFDTYAIKFNSPDNTIEYLFDQMSVRVITFAHIYQNLKTHSENTFNASFESYLNREGVNHEEFMNNINLMIMHARASLYSSIAYAISHTITKNDIINWFPQFEEDKKSLKLWSPECLKIIFNESHNKTEQLSNDNDSDNASQSVDILLENFQRDIQQYSEIFNVIIDTSQSYMKNHNSEYPSIKDVKKIEEKEEILRNNYLKGFEEKKIPLKSFYEIIDDTYEIMMLMEALHKKLFNFYDKGEIQAPMTPQLYYEYFSATSLRNSVFQTLIIINNDKKFKKILNELDESQSNNLFNNIGKYMNKQSYIGYNYIQE